MIAEVEMRAKAMVFNATRRCIRRWRESPLSYLLPAIDEAV